MGAKGSEAVSTGRRVRLAARWTYGSVQEEGISTIVSEWFCAEVKPDSRSTFLAFHRDLPNFELRMLPIFPLDSFLQLAPRRRAYTYFLLSIEYPFPSPPLPFLSDRNPKFAYHRTSLPNSVASVPVQELSGFL